MVSKSQREMNAKEMYLQENLLPPSIKEASIIVNETIEENIMIIQGMSSKVLHHKYNHLIQGIKFYFLVNFLLVITFYIKL
jgi:hypothetical protein